jgi:exopolyphosphatase/guanosine-5'-triphosphate,3'-diphosphate pyrophosphatase
MPRYAAIDVGTNSVLLLVAERDAGGRFTAIEERAEITRLGRGVDQARALAPQAIDETLGVVERFVQVARGLSANEFAISATSAARDATNGAVFLEAVKARTGLSVQIISGEEEARLSFASAVADFGGAPPLVVVDIGGGSTEFIFGGAGGQITFRRSFDVGAVRLTERHLKNDPPTLGELTAVVAALRETLAPLPRPAPGARLVGLAGTVTTLFAVAKGIDPYDAARVQGQPLTRDEVRDTVARLAALPVHLRRSVPGLQPKRADVIVAGGLVLQVALEVLSFERVTVSDRGLRWGLLTDRFGSVA